jgi:hypothetical protein
MLGAKTRVAALAAVLSSSLAPARAAADDSLSCEAAFSFASRRTAAGAFLDARRALLRCSQDGCPAAMRPLCSKDLGDLTARIPSVVFVAHGPDGHDLVDVRVLDAGVVVEQSLAGRAVDLDPGAHTFRFERAGGPPVEVQALIREGQKARVVEATFSPDASLPEPAATRRPIPWSVYLAGGISVALTIPLGRLRDRGA